MIAMEHSFYELNQEFSPLAILLKLVQKLSLLQDYFHPAGRPSQIREQQIKVRDEEPVFPLRQVSFFCFKFLF